MADTPRGRNKKITGTSGNIDKRGEGLGTGPVGNQQGYAGRPGTSSGTPSSEQPGGHSGYQGQSANNGYRPQGTGGPRSGGPGPDRPSSRGSNNSIPMTSTTSSGTTRGRRISPILIIVLIVVAFFLIRSCSSGSVVDYGDTSGSYSSSQGSSGVLETLPTEKPSGYGYSSSSGQSSSSGTSSSSSTSGTSSGYGSYSGFGSSGGYGNGYSYSSLFGNSGGYSNSSVSSGWSLSNNTGKLDSSVVSGARKKLTTIKGNGKDTVTVMVYMCGTDLESRSGMASSDLKEMASAEIGENVNIIVYTGGCRRWQTSGISSTVNQIYQVGSGSIKRLENDMGSGSMTNPNTLSEFIRYCAANFPANRNMLILWDHGGGSISGYGYDEKTSSTAAMTLDGIQKALKDGKVKFDVIGFDACLMATVETGLVCSDYADYLIASEETEPGYGWYYTNWITSISRNTSLPTIELGKQIVEDFVAYSARYAQGQKATLSVVDLAELAKTAPDSLKEFAASLSELLKGDDYKTVSDARSHAREFATSTKIDQIDLVSFANKVGTDEANALVEALLGAVKYNQTSTNMTDAYGLSIFFPYQKLSYVNKATSLYDSLGLDDDYVKACQEFASIETSGQAVSGGSTNPLYSLFGGMDYSGYSSGSYGSYGSSTGSSYGSSSGSSYGSGSSGYSGGWSSGTSSYDTYSSSDMLTGLLSQLLSGSYSGMSGFDSGSTSWYGKSIPLQDTAEYILQNHFDYDALVWEEDAAGNRTITLTGDQWALVHDLELNVFYDDGEGFVDLGLDNSFEISEDGALSGNYDGTWTAINGRAVAFYHEDTVDDGNTWSMTGRVPVLLNGERAELVLVFNEENPDGYVAGVRRVYADGETETVAKVIVNSAGNSIASHTSGDSIIFDGSSEVSEIFALQKGDRIDFICDYYSYSGEYLDSYIFGDSLVVSGDLEISYVYLPDISRANAVYRFTDLYGQNYWTPVM